MPSTTTTTSTSAVPAELAAFVAAPCSVLTDAQRTDISKSGTVLPKGEPKNNGTGPACEYVDHQRLKKGYFLVTVYIDADKGMQDLTADHAKGFSPDYWKPATLGDHQVIYHSSEGSQENCDVAIGFGHKSRVVIVLDAFDDFRPREQGSCKGTTAVAQQVVATIEGGA